MHFRRSARRGAVAAALIVGLGAVLPNVARAQEGQELGTWAFHFPDDTRPGALLDLRSLNEKTAGETGFIRLSADGNAFVRGDGQPIRFWACGDDNYRGSPEDMARNARFLARIGVNMVRLHTQINGNAGGPITDVNEKEIDGIWRMVAALKTQGIYTTISPYWATGKNATQWGIDGYTGQTDLWGLLFFNPQLQAGYKAWLKALYTRPNPYTGIPLSQDPAVAIIQVQNEDGMFFWTMQGVKSPQLALLGRQFAGWLAAQYGSLDKARQAWQSASAEGDDWAGGKVGILPTWNLTQDQTGGMVVRVADQVHFFADTQRDFYADIADYIHHTLGCQQLVNASNWQTADMVKLGDDERYTYTAADVIAVNKYYDGGVHLGANNGWRIDPGHHFTNESALLNPRRLPSNLKQVTGHPMVITESSWVAPLGFQSEGPFLMAAYQSLTGVDAFYWFSDGTPEYQTDLNLGFLNVNGQHPLGTKWSANIPMLMGQFPANALLYRRGYLKQGAPVIHEERPLAEMWDRKAPLIAEDGSFDPNRAGTAITQSSVPGAAPYAFLVGPVEVKYGGSPASDKAADLSPYIDTGAQVVKSDTGEIRLNYGKGVCVVNAPRAQGVTGFLTHAGGPMVLSDVTIDSRNPYATVLAVSMDGLPLKTSKEVLVQVGTVARPTGWQTRPSDFPSEDGKTTYHGYEITQVGTAPWQIVNTAVTVTVGNRSLTKATALDAAGYPVKSVPVTHAGGKMTIPLPPDALYVVLQ